jgi:hypothetical protein
MICELYNFPHLVELVKPTLVCYEDQQTKSSKMGMKFI